MTANVAHEVDVREGITDPDWRRRSVTAALPGEATITGPIGFQHTPRDLLIQVAGPAPAWLAPTIHALNRLLNLQANWDSHGAAAVELRHVVTGIELLSLVMHSDTPPPTIVPTTRGGIQLEWHVRGVDLEIEVLSPQRFGVLFEDPSRDEEWEVEISGDLTPLVKAIGRVSAT